MRVLLRLLSPLLGLVVAAAGALLTVEVITAWLSGARAGYPGLLVPWRSWRDTLGTLTWHSLPSLLGCAATAVLGLVLLLVAGAARRRDIRLADPTAEISMTAAPDVLARLVGQRVRADGEIVTASVTASARRVRVRAVGRGEHPGELRPAVTGQVHELIDDLPLRRRPRVSVRVHAARGLR